jgi:hypothetical protein
VLAIGAAGLALTVVVDIASSALDALGHASSDPTSTTDIWLVTGASMALCLAVAGGGGWVLAGGPDGLTPRWLAGLAVGLVGVAAGASVFAVMFGFTPI